MYLDNEQELVSAANVDAVAEQLKGTVGERLLRRDAESTVRDGGWRSVVWM